MRRGELEVGLKRLERDTAGLIVAIEAAGAGRAAAELRRQVLEPIVALRKAVAHPQLGIKIGGDSGVR